MSRSHAERFVVANRVARRAMVALVLGLALLAGCGGSDEPSPAAGPATSTTADTTSTTVDPPSTTRAPSTASSTPTPPATVPTTAAPDPEAEVKAAYLQIMDAYFARLLHPNPDDPGIDLYHIGPSARQVRDENGRYTSNGQTVKFGPNGAPEPEVTQVEVDDTTAVLQVCVVDDVSLVDVETGAVTNGTTASKLFRSTLIRENGKWKLSEQALIRRTVGAQGC